ncbi:hypothetical protein J6590_001552 [Homalodisca vitripennis]|nr:hypothetical protein J6590_001552 [Homalodisca vitripennis]
MIRSEIACEKKTKLAKKRTRIVRKKLLDAENEKNEKLDFQRYLRFPENILFRKLRNDDCHGGAATFSPLSTAANASTMHYQGRG